MQKNDKIYVAGHNGLVGSAIVRLLKEKGFTNIIYKSHKELPLDRQKETEDFFLSEKPDYVFLAAAKVGGIYANNTFKADFIYQNLMIASNIIAAAWKSGVKKLMNLGSSCIYPKFAKQPMTEDQLLTGILEATNEPYAIAKISAIKLCRYFNEQYHTDFLSVMPTNLYGPHDNFDLMNSHVLPALMRKIHLAKLLEEGRMDLIRNNLAFHEKKPEFKTAADTEILEFLAGYNVFKDKVAVWGSGKPFREFLHVDDMASACVYLMENYHADGIGEFVNIGTGRDISIYDLACLVKDTVGFKGELFFDSSKPDGTPKKLQDVSRLNSLGWKASIDLAEGLKRTYDWYLKNSN